VNIFTEFDTRIRAAIGELQKSGDLPSDLDLSKVSTEPPRDDSHGDISTNVAMVLAKPAGKNPREIAVKISDKLSQADDVLEVTIAGPGFINLRLADQFWHEVVRAALSETAVFGTSSFGKSEKINVEYVSVNPTGPLHVGHCRGAVFGDALANLLDFAGYDVVREYYFNDAGAQIDALARSVHWRVCEALGEDLGEMPEGLYPGEYLKPLGEKLAGDRGAELISMAENEWLPVLRSAGIDAMMTLIRQDLALLGIHHDVFFSELSLHGDDGGEIKQTVDSLNKKGLIYEGVLPPPKGQLPQDWEAREQTLFRATDFGDDIDRPLMKSNGDYTYFAADVAYFKNKFDRGFSQMIYVLGADHSGYVKRLQAVGKAISDDKAQAIVRICQMVKLFRDGVPVKMSKRAGNFITLRDVVEEVGSDSVRFMMLYRKNDAPLDFDFVKVTEQSRDNPVFYVQYAHARICSVMRGASENIQESELSNRALSMASLELLDDDSERQLMRKIAAFPRIIESAARVHEPHRLAFFLYEVASAFHSLWNKGKELPHLRFIDAENGDTTRARLALIRATAHVIASGLTILGVDATEEMR
jgi:arginyl-tRNA synthetase